MTENGPPSPLARQTGAAAVPPASVPCRVCCGTGRLRSNEDIGAECRARRLATGASVQTIATRMGVSRPYLNMLELGRRSWTAKQLTAFLDAVGGEAAG